MRLKISFAVIIGLSLTGCLRTYTPPVYHSTHRQTAHSATHVHQTNVSQKLVLLQQAEQREKRAAEEARQKILREIRTEQMKADQIATQNKNQVEQARHQASIRALKAQLEAQERQRAEEIRRIQQEERDLQKAIEESYKTKAQEDARRQQAELARQQQEERDLQKAIEESYKTKAQEDARRQQAELARQQQEERDLQKAIEESYKTKAQEDARRQQAEHACQQQEERDLQQAIANSLRDSNVVSAPVEAAPQVSEGQIVVAGEKIMQLQRNMNQTQGRNATYAEITDYLRREMHLESNQVKAILDAMYIE